MSNIPISNLPDSKEEKKTNSYSIFGLQFAYIMLFSGRNQLNVSFAWL